MERNTLMAKCYPRIKDYCREKHGLEFQVIFSIFIKIDRKLFIYVESDQQQQSASHPSRKKIPKDRSSGLTKKEACSLESSFKWKILYHELEICLQRTSAKVATKSLMERSTMFISLFPLTNPQFPQSTKKCVPTNIFQS